MKKAAITLATIACCATAHAQKSGNSPMKKEVAALGVVAVCCAPAPARAQRAMVMHLENLSGADIVQCTLMRKRGPKAYKRHRALHCVLSNNAAVQDYGTLHAHAYEFRADLPADLLRRDEFTPTNVFDGVPWVETQPGTPAALRNIVVDIEGAQGDGLLVGAVVAPNRNNDGHFVSLLYKRKRALDPNLSIVPLRIREFTVNYPNPLKRADGGPLHVFWGSPVFTEQPE